MNNKGFAISAMLYGVVFLGITIILLLMSTITFTKKTENKTIDSIEEELGNMESIKFETGNIVKDPNTTVLPSLNYVVVDVRVYYGGGSLDTSNLASKLSVLVDGYSNGKISNIQQVDEVDKKVKLLKITMTGFTKNGALQLKFDEGALVILRARKVRNSKTLINIDLSKKNIQYSTSTFNNYVDSAYHGLGVNLIDPTSNYSIYYGINAGVYNLEASPKFADIGVHPVYFKITAPGYNSVTGMGNVTIKKKETFNYSANGWTGTYDGASHGISVSVSNTSGATIRYGTLSGNYNLTSSPTYVNAGTNTVYYQITKENFTTVTGSCNVTINRANMSVAVSGWTGSYDAAYHGITVRINSPGSGATIKYGSSSGSYPSTGTLSYKSGTNTVYFQVTCPNYNTYNGSAVVKVTDPTVYYAPHLASYGWQGYSANGAQAGTTGQSLNMEAIKIKLADMVGYGGNICYTGHAQSIGWQGEVCNDGIAGTTGQSKRLEAKKIRLTGTIANYYNVYYRPHVQSIGWLGWGMNNQAAGTTGYAYSLQAINIRLVRKGDPAPGANSGYLLSK